MGKVEGGGAKGEEGTAVTSKHLSFPRQARTLGNSPDPTDVRAPKASRVSDARSSCLCISARVILIQMTKPQGVGRWCDRCSCALGA